MKGQSQLRYLRVIETQRRRRLPRCHRRMFGQRRVARKSSRRLGRSLSSTWRAGGPARIRWPSEPAHRWKRGEGTADPPKARSRETRNFFSTNPQILRDWLRDGLITSRYAEDWYSYLVMSDAEFEGDIAARFPSGRLTHPAHWAPGATARAGQIPGPRLPSSWARATPAALRLMTLWCPPR